MKIKELLEALKKCNPEGSVWVVSCRYNGYEDVRDISEIVVVADKDEVVISSTDQYDHALALEYMRTD